MIAGEAGIGKSRLVRELLGCVRKERSFILEGACLEYLSTPFAPFVDALGAHLAGRDIERALRKIETERVSSAGSERARRFALVEDQLRRWAAANDALVLAIDDLQWSDAASLDLLRYLIRRLRDAPVLIVVTARCDDAQAARAAQTATLVRDGAALLVLERLPDKQIGDLLRSIVQTRDAVSAAELRRIGELAEGNPLVAEELLRGALDGAVPLSVRGGVLERLRAIDPRGQNLLCDAAVIGRSFAIAVLERVSEMDAGEILTTLRRARQLQLIAEDEPGGPIRFRHAITREIVYSELLSAEVRLRHERIAHVLEDADPPSSDEAAYHWSAAGNALRAADANEAAGDRAAAIYAYADAACCYERAVRFAAGRRRAEVIDKLAFALCAIGEMETARRWCEEGAALLASLGEVRGAQRFLLWVARQLYEAGEVDRAFETIDAVRTELRDLPRTQIHCTAETTLAAMLATLGRAQDALDVLAALEEQACEADPVDGFRLHNARGNALCSLGKYGAAYDAYGRAFALPGLSDELRFYAQLNIGNAALLLGETDRSASAYEVARDLARERGLQRHGAMIATSLACVALYRGELRTALAHYVEVVENASAVAMTVGFAHAVGIRLLGFLGNVVELADLDVSAAVDAAFALRESQTTAVVAGAAAQLWLARGETAAAQGLVERALATVTVPDYAYWLCDAAGTVADDEAAARARALLELAARDGSNRAGAAYLALFDARRDRRSGAPRASSGARTAAVAFETIGWPLEAAAAFEVAGDPAAAQACYTACGLAYHRRKPARPKAAGSGSDGSHLSRREAQVAELVVRGYTSREIGAALKIGERTVETHVSTIFRKVGVRTRVELAARLRS